MVNMKRVVLTLQMILLLDLHMDLLLSPQQMLIISPATLLGAHVIRAIATVATSDHTHNSRLKNNVPLSPAIQTTQTQVNSFTVPCQRPSASKSWRLHHLHIPGK